MKKIYKTEKNLQNILDNLDKAYERMEKVIEDLSLMVNIPDGLKNDVEKFDMSAISRLKAEVEELLLKLKGEF
jgi:hypothetical protein